MSNHFFAINRGQSPFVPVNILRTAATTAAADVEVRVADVDGQGNPLTRKDVVLALQGIISLLEASGASPDGTNFPPL